MFKNNKNKLNKILLKYFIIVALDLILSFNITP